MITKQQALSLSYQEILHADASGVFNQCKHKVSKWRVNGACQTWKSAKNQQRFRVPLKHGLYNFWELTERNAQWFHREQDCPVVHPQKQKE